MIAYRTFRKHMKFIVAFTLLWAFLMPTIETVVTPVSRSIPAVSSGATGNVVSATVSPSLEKPDEAVLCESFSILFFTLLPVLSAYRLRRTRAIPLLIKSLLLRPIKFTSKYIAV
ncbi:hypothetical protein [Paenibacillus ginsengarvi]|uniref:Uncharacterized protein n=1 Tax=Paenibacillus ginsengarvi TaxID=400777 RepID=A0A3B0CHD8_9BACL|nr:hypothetical protein [Paenibacillus ginsengarvi]RKN85165.1 hypothetical protein D7M11_08735 [Paenibacillus ginsengarvi]